VTIREPTQVTSCCNLLAPVRQLSFNSRSARIYFSHVQRVFIVEHYLVSRSYLSYQNEFRDTFPDFTGSVRDRNRSDRPSVLSDDSLDDIRQTLLRSARKSRRKLSVQSGLSYGSVYKTTTILKLQPYRVDVMHEIEEPDKEKQLQCCRWSTQFIRGGIDILEQVFCSDETWFYLTGYVNSQNSRLWML
jgi:hypothetical protein